MKDTNDVLQDLIDEVQYIEVPDVKNLAKARFLAEQKSTHRVLFVRPLSSIFAGVIILVLLLVGLSQTLPITPPSITLSAEEKESILLQSISSVTLLLHEDVETNISFLPLSVSEEDESSLIHDFILTLEQLVSTENISTLSTSSFSTLPGYTYKETIEFTSLFDQQFFYEFHYELTTSSETNTQFVLHGLLIMEEKEFIVNGKKVSQQDEVSYDFEISKSETETVAVSFHDVGGEIEYHFQITSDNTIKELRFKKIKDTLTPQFEIKLSEGDKEEEYIVEKDTLGQKISMQAKNNTHRIEVQMKKENMEAFYEYHFPDSGKTIQKNPRHPHQDGHPGRRPNNNTNF